MNFKLIFAVAVLISMAYAQCPDNDFLAKHVVHIGSNANPKKQAEKRAKDR